MSRRTPRRRTIEPRIRTYFGAEGAGEKSLANWLEDIRNSNGRRHHHDVHNLLGGDTLSLVEKALKKRRQRDLLRPNGFVKSFLLLDFDRHAQDGERSQEAERLARRNGLIVIWQLPNLEGLLLRLFPDCETLKLPAPEIDRNLERKWPGYTKTFSRQDLQDRFTLEDLRRAARFDENLLRLLRELDLAG